MMADQVKIMTYFNTDKKRDYQGVVLMDRASLFKYICEYRDQGILYFNFWDCKENLEGLI